MSTELIEKQETKCTTNKNLVDFLRVPLRCFNAYSTASQQRGELDRKLRFHSQDQIQSGHNSRGKEQQGNLENKMVVSKTHRVLYIHLFSSYYIECHFQAYFQTLAM